MSLSPIVLEEEALGAGQPSEFMELGTGLQE